MKKPYRILLASAVAALSTSASHAAFTLVNNFDSVTGNWDKSGAGGPPGNPTLVSTTASFGSGASYVDLSDVATGGFGYEASDNAAFNALGTSGSLSFEYFAPNSDWTFSIGTEAFSANRAFTTNIPLTTNTAYQISFLYNISGDSLTYDDPTVAGLSDGTLANNTAVIFAQERGSSTISKGSDIARNGTVALDGLWFTRTNNSGTTSTLLDHLQQSTSLEVLVIPEPSALLLGVIGAITMLRRRR